MIAWGEVTGTEIRVAEFAILHSMDVAFCEATNLEISEWREREKERQKQEQELNRSTRRRR